MTTRAQFANQKYKHANGWDHPPEVASPESLDSRNENYGHWKIRPCKWKTPQRLLTLDSNSVSRPQHDEQKDNEIMPGRLLCAPIIAHNRYVLVASNMNISVFGNFGKDEPYEEIMQSRIDTTATTSLSRISLSSEIDNSSSPYWDDTIIQLSFHEETNILYALSVQSCVFQIKLIVDNQTIDSSPDNSEGNHGEKTATTTGVNNKLPELSLLHQWGTKKLGISCMATLHDGLSIGIDTVCVGYKSGVIEAWNVDQVHSLRPKQRTGALRGTQQRATKKKQGCTLQWEGYLHDSIRTLSFLFRHNHDAQVKSSLVEEQAKTSSKTPQDTGNEHSGRVKDHYLIVVVAIGTSIADKGRQQPTSSMLKILNLEQIMNEAIEITKRSGERVDTSISLERYVLPASHGMGLVDATTKPQPRASKKGDRGFSKTQVPILESHGADAACNFMRTIDNGDDRKSCCVGIAFPDGNIALFSSTHMDGFSGIGLDNGDQQTLLSYPAIGIGQLDMNEGRNKGASSYFVACLRGGTCYLFPCDDKNKSKKNPVTSIPFPHDIESDVPYIYVQAFNAGNLMVDGNLLPVLIYAWPGGLVDIYSCGLTSAKHKDESSPMMTIDNINSKTFVSRVERMALQDLIDNESLLLLSHIIDELRADSDIPLLLQNEAWHQLFKEAQDGGSDAIENITSVDDLCLQKHQTLRTILLQLGLVEE